MEHNNGRLIYMSFRPVYDSVDYASRSDSYCFDERELPADGLDEIPGRPDLSIREYRRQWFRATELWMDEDCLRPRNLRGRKI